MFTAVNRILFPLFGAAVRPPLAFLRGRVGVALFDAPDHLAVERFTERLERSGDGLGVGIFRAKVREDGGVGFVAQPEIIVDARVAVERDIFGFLRSEGRFRGSEREGRSERGGGRGHERDDG